MKLGTDEFGKVFLGDDYVERIYQGDDQIYSVYKYPKDSEIVFRPTDNKEQLSVDDPYFGYAKIDSIKGKSLVWNQMVHNGNFADGVTGWVAGFGTISVNDNILTYSVTEPTTSPCIRQDNFPDIANHKYLFTAEFNYSTKPTYTSTGFLGIGGYYGAYWYIQDIVPNSWFKVSGIVTSTGVSPTKDLRFYLRTTGMTAGDTIKVKNVIAVDLTLMFGSGNEPATVAEFESLFPLPYYSYNAGTLISNDAETLETVGFNQLVSEPLNLVTTRFFPSFDKNIYTRVFGGIPYYFRISAPQIANWRFAYKLFDLDGNEITVGAFASIGVATPYYNTSNNCWIDGTNHPVNQFALTFTQDCYVYFGYGAGAVTADTKMENANLNISDPSKNGTYEPYWKSTLPLNLDYLPIKSHNIWDEEWELGYIDDNGDNVPFTNRIRSKNYTPIVNGQTYFIKSSYAVYPCFYDADKNYISQISISGSHKFTSPTDAAFMRFWVYQLSTYNYDICINVSDPDFNGQYEPYALRGGLKGTGTAYDLGKVEDDGYIHEVTKVMGEVDLGTLNWQYVEIYGIFASSVIPDMYFSNNNVICERYITAPIAGAQTAPDKSIYLRGDLAIGAKDSAYTTDATAFKTAMNGVKAYYELATPITYELVTPIKAIYKVDKRGTEQATFPTHSDGSPSAPLCAEIGYPK